MEGEWDFLSELKPKYKFWLESDDGYVFGEGAFELLRGIQETGSLSGSARHADMSYRHAWGIIKEIEERIGKPILDTYKGGSSGGGAELTPTGLKLLNLYLMFKRAFEQTRINHRKEGLEQGT